MPFKKKRRAKNATEVCFLKIEAERDDSRKEKRKESYWAWLVDFFFPFFPRHRQTLNHKIGHQIQSTDCVPILGFCIESILCFRWEFLFWTLFPPFILNLFVLVDQSCQNASVAWLDCTPVIHADIFYPQLFGLEKGWFLIHESGRLPLQSHSLSHHAVLARFLNNAWRQHPFLPKSLLSSRHHHLTLRQRNIKWPSTFFVPGGHYVGCSLVGVNA